FLFPHRCLDYKLLGRSHTRERRRGSAEESGPGGHRVRRRQWPGCRKPSGGPRPEELRRHARGNGRKSRNSGCERTPGKHAAMGIYEREGVEFALVARVFERAKVSPIDFEPFARRGLQANEGTLRSQLRA